MRPISEVTHAVEADYQERPRTIVQAVCGAYVRKGDATPTPSCPVCRQWLREQNAARPLAERV